MIRFIKGKYISNGIDNIVIENNGMGFFIKASTKTIGHFNLSDDITVYTYMSVREDDISLYGFTSNEELSMFTLLISVSGIGPKVALGILDEHIPEKIIYAIINGDIDMLTRAKGIGKKTAQRLILELKDKMKAQDISEIETDIQIDSDNRKEAIEALMALGYSKKESLSVVLSVYTEEMSTTDIIKKSLSQFVK